MAVSVGRGRQIAEKRHDTIVLRLRDGRREDRPVGTCREVNDYAGGRGGAEILSEHATIGEVRAGKAEHDRLSFDFSGNADFRAVSKPHWRVTNRGCKA